MAGSPNSPTRFLTEAADHTEGPAPAQVVESKRRRPMTEMQLAHSVHKGRRVTLALADEKINGYVTGWDDHNYLLMEPDGTQRIVSRTAVVTITLHTEATLHNEPLFTALNGRIEPFRRWVRTNILNTKAESRP